MLHLKDCLLYLKHENFKLDCNIEKIGDDVSQNQLASDIDSRVETWRTTVWTQEASAKGCIPTYMSMKAVKNRL